MGIRCEVNMSRQSQVATWSQSKLFATNNQKHNEFSIRSKNIQLFLPQEMPCTWQRFMPMHSHWKPNLLPAIWKCMAGKCFRRGIRAQTATTRIFTQHQMILGIIFSFMNMCVRVCECVSVSVYILCTFVNSCMKINQCLWPHTLNLLPSEWIRRVECVPFIHTIHKTTNISKNNHFQMGGSEFAVIRICIFPFHKLWYKSAKSRNVSADKFK